MFDPVRRGLFRTLIYALVVAQALSLVPVATMAAASHDPGAAGMHCEDMHPDQHAAKRCPCCPEGLTNVAACATVCNAMVGAVSTLVFSIVRSAPEQAGTAMLVPRTRLSEPPPNPPPIA